MTRLLGHFDGRVLVPDGPVSLPQNQQLVIHVEPAPNAESRLGMTGAQMVELARKLNFPKEDLAEMVKAIEEGCERIDHDGW